MARELLFSVTKGDFRVDTFRAGGKGGQHQNKTESAVRITHLASGAVGISRDHRSQPQNRKEAFLRLVKSPKFQNWLRVETARAQGRVAGIDAWVDEQMRPENLKIEYGAEERECQSDLLAKPSVRSATRNTLRPPLWKWKGRTSDAP